MTLNKRLGIIAYANNTGLGNQTRQYYEWLKPAKTMVVDLSDMQRQSGKNVTSYFERYPDGLIIEGIPSNLAINSFLEDLDVVLVAETPLNHYLFKRAAELNIRTILVPNYEFNDYLQHPWLPRPDLLLLPSKWHMQETKELGIQMQHIPMPVDRSKLPFIHRKKAEHFVHIAGHPTFMDRNGTAVVLEAMQYVKSPIQLTMYSQFPIEAYTDDRINLVKEYWELYKPEYDVMVMPRRYGGLCLPLNEAMSVGMPVLMTDVPPQNEFLPPEMLIREVGYDIIQTRAEIECWKPSPKALAAKIDELYNKPELVDNLSKAVDNLAEARSWKKLAPIYMEIINNL